MCLPAWEQEPVLYFFLTQSGQKLYLTNSVKRSHSWDVESQWGMWGLGKCSQKRKWAQSLGDWPELTQLIEKPGLETNSVSFSAVRSTFSNLRPPWPWPYLVPQEMSWFWTLGKWSGGAGTAFIAKYGSSALLLLILHLCVLTVLPEAVPEMPLATSKRARVEAGTSEGAWVDLAFSPVPQP